MPMVHHGVLKGVFHAIRSGRWKFIDGDTPKLYDLKTDLEELNNVYSSHQKLGDSLRQTMTEMIKRIADREAESDYGIRKTC